MMMNRFTYCALMILLNSSTTTITAFVPSSLKQQQSSLFVAADATRTAPVLVPPTDGSTDDITTMYDTNVQKTYGRYPLTIKSGKGCKLFTTTSDDYYLDFVSGIATCALGHAHPKLTEAITQQMQKVHHVSNLYYIPEQARLAKWLCDNSCADKAFFCNSGAEANEAAIKCARKHASKKGITKPVIVTAEQSFHGRTLAALTATAQPKYHKGFTYDGEMVPGFVSVPYNDIEKLKEIVAEITNADDGRGLAAIMLEPLQGEGGIVPGKKEYFAEARRLCDEAGALLVLDEVQAGMGRTGMLWGHENLDIEPDIFTSAKALGGGVPIGAMMALGFAATTFQPGDHASTYGGNPLACAAGLTVAKTICEENLLQNVRDRSQQLSSGLKLLSEKYPQLLGEVRGWGLLMGIVVLDGNEYKASAGDVVGECMKEGLLLVPAGANVVRFVPPLIVTEEEINEALTKFEAAIQTTTKA